MKKIIFYALCSILFIGIGTGCGSKSNPENNTTTETTDKKDTDNTKPAKEKYKKLAKELNAPLPMPLPGGMRFDKTEALSEKEFKYYYTFTIDPMISSDEFKRSAKLPLAVGLREGKADDLNMFRKDKLTIIYAYYKMDGSLFAEVVLTPEEYLK